MTDHAKFLSTVAIFSSLSPAELDAFSADWELIETKEKQVIFRKGDVEEHLYLIVKGSISIAIKTFDKVELILSELHEGEIFGELTLFDNAPRTATATALDKATLLKMSREKYIRFLKLHPDVAIAMLGVLGKHLRETNEIMETQVTRNVNQIMESELTFGERLSDSFAEFIGSWTFIIIFTVGLIVWILLNVYEILFKPVDPYPFILLNLILSCIAAIQAPVIMMSQGRQSTKDRIAADLDYKINLKAELQIEEIQEKIDRISALEMEELKELHKIQRDILGKLAHISDNGAK